MLRIGSFVGGVLAVLLLAASADAATLKVGNGKTYATIGDAVAAAATGDKILVFKGRYTETVTVAVPNLTLKATKGVKWLPELWNQNCLVLDAAAEGATVTGFMISTTRDAVTVNAEAVTISKCRFRGGDAISGTEANSLLITRCDIRWGSSAVDVDGDGVTLERTRVAHHNSGPVRIEGNDTTIFKCVLVGSTDDHGIDLTDCCATDCAAEGLHNSGTTSFGGCTFLDNRQDVGSDDGTLTDGGGNTFDTGGPTSPPID